MQLSDLGAVDAEVGAFSEGLAAVKVNSGLSGYIDEVGKLVIPARFRIAGDFRDGQAIVGQRSTHDWDENLRPPALYVGFIQKSGQFVVSPVLANAYPFSNGVALARPHDCSTFFQSDNRGAKSHAF